MKHRAIESWEQRADRCIRELQGPAGHYGKHRLSDLWTYRLMSVTYRVWTA